MDSQGAGFAFDTINMDFSAFTMPQQQQSFAKPSEDNTSGFFFGDEGIDTTTSFIDPTVFNTPQEQSFDISHNLAMDNTSVSASAWNTQLTPQMHHTLNSFPPTPAQSFDALFQQPATALGKRSLQLDVHDFPQSKRHEPMADFTLFSSLPSSVTSPSWALETQTTPASSAVEVGLSDEAADVCATWFNKFNVLPSDRHIDSLSQLTGESADAVRNWFGRLLKQGMGGNDSAYKSQTALIQQEPFWNDQFSTNIIQASPPQLLLQAEETTSSDAPCTHDTTTVSQPASTLRGSKKRCTPTEDQQLLSRDPNKIYQCTRKCGKRYGRKCDWKRNEEEGYPCKSWVCSLCTSEGVENVKPCFRKYHFVQHFRNIHPDINAELYEEASVVCSETEFPRKCGFCRHHFVSRQERIDHIADHFKQGKCMLDWNEEDASDGHDSDNTDDDDDRPSGDGFDGSGPSYQPPGSDQRGDPSPKYYGGGGSSDSGGQPPNGGFFQFQLSQFEEGGNGSQSSCAQQHILPIDNEHGEGSIHGSSSTERPVPEKHYLTTTDDSEPMARDAVPLTLLDQDQAKQAKTNHEGVLLENHRQKRATVSIVDVDATWPGVELDSSQKNDTVREGVAIAMPTSVNRTRLQLTDGRRSPSPSALLPVAATLAHTALSSGQEDTLPISVSQEPKVLPIAETATGESIIARKALQSIPTTSQSFLSVKLLGAGGFSTVDEVVHRDTNLRMGRKTLKNRDQTAVEEIRKEVNVLQKLRHPHVIRFLGAYSNGDKMSILVSPVADTTLALWLERSSVLKPANLAEKVVKMFGCLASSVRYLHEQRPVLKHMDIKPQNILIVEGDQEFPHVVLSDFGISSSEDISDGQSKPLTRQYIAPEVLEGFTRNQAADIWSLGCVFAEMASVSYGQGNSAWLSFRNEYSGRTGKYYWQDVSGVQHRLSGFLADAATPTEQTVVRTLKTMLSPEPAKRPDAASLTMVFTPAPCCLNWPNDKAIFPGPHEELGGVEMLVPEDGTDCCTQLHLRGRTTEDTDTSLLCAKSWLEECSHSHEACHQQALSGTKFLPTRLVDVRPNGQAGSHVSIVNTSSLEVPANEIDYVALSHVWTKEHITLSSDSIQGMLTELPLQALPMSVKMAISATQQLGYRYIWVDSLCVLQDSEHDKQRECATMASVFRNASLTVVLDQLTTNSLEDKDDDLDLVPLLGSKPKSIIQEGRQPASAVLPAIDFTTPGFAWDTRAWALQERLLSRRFLHLGEQMYWECNELKASETFPRGLSPLIWEKVHSRAPKDVHATLNGRRMSNTSIPASSSLFEKHPRRPAASRLRDCQLIKKEGDGIGDSMQASQTLKFGDAKASSTYHGRGHDHHSAGSKRTRLGSAKHVPRRVDETCDTAFSGDFSKGNPSRHQRIHISPITTLDKHATIHTLTATNTNTIDNVNTAPDSSILRFRSRSRKNEARKEINLSGQLDQNGSQAPTGVLLGHDKDIVMEDKEGDVSKGHVRIPQLDGQSHGLD
ncbi:hypothetical protein BKA66DRAFT_456070 [Pyrenochaeta sp. MPI-SDFR-AT-0127]|nr:hypothetical protein BKA66DRAFT_456070 [Pyrenochaeta sp. MPI-SDFR-AT-0127]